MDCNAAKYLTSENTTELTEQLTYQNDDASNFNQDGQTQQQYSSNIGIYIRALGNAPLIGKACIFIDIPQQCSFILDCGIPDNYSKGPQIEKQLKYDSKIVFPDHDADFMFISHAHQDHAGAVEQILAFQSQTVDGRKQSTKQQEEQPWDIKRSEVLATQIQEDANCSRRGHKHVYSSVLTRELMINANPAVKNAITGIEFYGKVFPIEGRTDIYFIITPAGHIPGSAIFTIVTPVLTLVYTGDYLLNPTALLSGAKFPQEAANADVLISEVTFVQFVFRSPVFSDLLWFQHVLQLALAKIPVVLPISSFGTAQERISLIGDLLKHFFFDKNKINIEVVQGSQAEIFHLFRRYLEQCEANKARSGLFLGGLFQKYKQFREEIDGKRQIVFSCPQKFSGGVTLDLLFEKLENQQGLMCFSGNSQPGTQNWRFLNNTVTQIKRDNMKTFVPVQWTCSQTQYQSHADFVQFNKMLQFVKPKFLILTHTSDTRNLSLVKQYIEQCSSGYIKCSVLSQTATILRFRDEKDQNNVEKVIQGKNIVLRIKYNNSLELLIQKLLKAGFNMVYISKSGIYKCGKNFCVTKSYILLRLLHKIPVYKHLFDILGFNYLQIKNIVQNWVKSVQNNVKVDIS